VKRKSSTVPTVRRSRLDAEAAAEAQKNNDARNGKLWMRNERIGANSKTAKSVADIAKIAGAGPACIPRGTGRVLFEQSKKLPGLIGLADCNGEHVSLLLYLTTSEAACALQTLIFMRTERKK
jgi:hypothetical protein